jgi:hypothetical protein
MDFEEMRLAIAMPNTQAFYPKQFVDSFMVMRFPLHTIYCFAGTTGPVDSVRNELVEKAKIADATHIFMLDTDQIYPQDVFLRLAAHEKDIVAAKVHRRRPPFDPILLRGSIDKFDAVPDEEWTKGGLVEVDATGFGCVLISMEVFKAIEKPWFAFDLYNRSSPVGEDIYFYDKAKKAGFDVFVDCDIKIGHIHSFIVNEETYFTYKYNTAWDRESVEET